MPFQIHVQLVQSRKVLALFTPFVLISACGTDQSASALQTISVVPGGVATSSPSPSTAPTPTFTPTPTLSPSPTPVATLKGVLAEGDSISAFVSGSYTSLYAAAHPSLVFHGTAMGGSFVTNANGNGLVQRLAADMAFRPAVVTVLIGANDLGDPAWLSNLWNYTDQVRATGAKVAVGTILPRYLPGFADANAAFMKARATTNLAIRAAVGAHIDAVIDFAADPMLVADAAAQDPALFPDGTHPSPAVHVRMSQIYGPVVNNLLRP